MMPEVKSAIQRGAESQSSLGRVIRFLIAVRAEMVHYIRYRRAEREARSGFLQEHGTCVAKNRLSGLRVLNAASLPDVTYATKCWENDWRYVLNERFLKKAMETNAYPFTDRIVIINNVQNRALVRDRAERLVQSGILTRYFFADDYARDVLDYFSLSKDALKGGYYYSICELAGIYFCKTKYLLHYSSDTSLQNLTEWIPEGLHVLENENARVVNPTWNGRFSEARAESMRQTDKFFVGYGFSDHCYLIRAADFKAPIYSTSHPASDRYPAYGGELFEKKVDSWMRNNGWLRFTHKKAYYLHYNYPPKLA